MGSFSWAVINQDEVNIIKDKLTLSTSKNDNNINAVLQNGNKPTKKVIVEFFNERHIPVINLGNTRTLQEETEYVVTDEDNVLLFSKETCMTLSLVEDNRKWPRLRKSSQKFRQIRKNSKRFQQRKQIGAANRKPNLFLHSLSMFCVFVSIVKAKTVVCTDTVTWEVKTEPILFGETLELLCKISEKRNECQGSFQQWYGSKEDILLCQNGKCRNDEKYTVKKNANCSYSLLIHNLSISDVDISYSCAFGLNEMKKGLMMTDYEFLKLPRNSSVIPLVTTNDSIVDVLLKMDDIYPVPKCTVKLKKGHERDITEKADISFNVTQDSIFYTYKMHIMQNVSQLECGSILSVHCLIGSFLVTNLSKELDNCTDFNSITLGGNNMTVVAPTVSPVVIGVVVICVVVIGVALISVIIYHKRTNRRRNHGYPVREKPSEMVAEYTSESSRLEEID
ncbi:unnamed protein product [Mytilus coruscus]|uniref:Ig-like domain-containing protein n=1 Tax=Mytilus coruscus TaxID=42192 RepID=A0A6J8E8G3_MYTCO|nr:unnamed protein product [Mytilus coruscus]